MGSFALNAVAFAVVLALILGVWTTVHLLARRRMGDRKLGCRGPTIDELGNSVCCNSGFECERNEAPREAAEAAGEPVGRP